VREVEALHRKVLGAARESVYIENQYLTSVSIAEWIAARLREAQGPEFVLVTSHACSGWLEQATMGSLRARFVAQLREADRFGRLRIFYPRLPGAPQDRLTVHTKLLIADARFLRIGSSNLSNRSLGLDTECDLALEDGGEPRVAGAIAGLRSCLLAEHLGRTPAQVDAALRREGSLIAAIESLRGGERSLVPLRCESPAWRQSWLPDSALWDPEGPAAIDAVLAQVPEQRRGAAGRPASRALSLALVLAGLTAIGLITALADGATASWLSAELHDLRRGSAGGTLLGLAGFVVASLLGFPVTLLCAAAALVLGWKLGFAVALAGSLASAVLAYAIGKLLWRDLVQWLAGRRLCALHRALANRGFWAVAALRLIPIAPFSVVNLVAGATRVRLLHFALGTAVAMTPVALAIALFADHALAAWQRPSACSALAVAGIALAGVAAALSLRRWLTRRGAA
jgi:uncharacterized membrane protein YdjX (TVP38/TMEM64 family)